MDVNKYLFFSALEVPRLCAIQTHITLHYNVNVSSKFYRQVLISRPKSKLQKVLNVNLWFQSCG